MLDGWLSSWHRKMSVEVWNNYPIRLGRVRPLCGDGEAGLRHKPGQGSGKTSSMCRENLPMPLQKSIFSLNLYIFRLKIHIFRLNLYIFSLKMKFSAALHLFWGYIGRIFRIQRGSLSGTWPVAGRGLGGGKAQKRLPYVGRTALLWRYPGGGEAVYFTSQVSLVISSSAKLWYFFFSLTSSICACTASS